MDSMSLEEAFEILELPLDADEVALKKAYRKKSFVSHPDKIGGNEKHQVKLNKAYEIASAIILGHNALISLRAGRSIQLFEKAIVSQQASQEAAETVKLIQRRRTRPIQNLKYLAFIVSGFSAGVAWFGNNLLPLLFPGTTTEISATYTRGFALLSLFFVFAGGILHILVQRLEHMIESYTEELNNPRVCASNLAHVLNYKTATIVHEDDILGSPSANMSTGTFCNMKTIERKRLLLLKSLEHSLLVAMTPEKILPDSVVRYRVRFDPTLFQPPEPTVPKIKQKSAFEARMIILSAALGICVFGALTLYLAIMKNTYWSILPGFFVLAALGGVGGGITDYKAAVRRSKEKVNEDAEEFR